MKIKRFDNLWTMGLILCGAILVILYLAKLIFPEWVIGVAQYEPIVEFGNYVDSHWWSYYPISMAFSYGIGYVYLCACCRTKRLNLKENIIVALEVILFNLIDIFLPSQAFNANIFLMLLMPLLALYIRKENDIKFMYSTILTFVIHSSAQILSLSIRDIGTKLSHFNTATLTILLIDCYIWLALLYFYYNYKKEEE